MEELTRQLIHNSTSKDFNISIGDKVVYVDHNGALAKGKVLEVANNIRPAVRVKAKCLDGSMWLLESSCLKLQKENIFKKIIRKIKR